MKRRDWVPQASEDFVQTLAERLARRDTAALLDEIERLTAENRTIHEKTCINLNPATNVMNPRAEALLAQGLGTRPSLGYPGAKYEMGLEAIEQLEVLATALACEIFAADYAEIRVSSGAMANLYAFMATCAPGDTIIVPPAAVGGHITHHQLGAAGLYGLEIVAAPVDADGYSVDVPRLAQLAAEVRPRLITIGSSLNLFPHPVREIRAIADAVGAAVLYDAAHASGMIAGGGWQQPLAEGAHLMTMSTYKSLGGPAAGLILTNDKMLAERLDKIAFPGLTANFDAAKTAALAVTLLDWRTHGRAYARAMRETARALATAIQAEGAAVFAAERGATTSHQFALEAEPYGGGQAAAKRLRQANVLSCGIGLPLAAVAGDLNGLRLGTPEIVRWGMKVEDMAELAYLMARVLVHGEAPESVAAAVTNFRQQFQQLHFINK